MASLLFVKQFMQPPGAELGLVFVQHCFDCFALRCFALLGCFELLGCSSQSVFLVPQFF